MAISWRKRDVAAFIVGRPGAFAKTRSLTVRRGMARSDGTGYRARFAHSSEIMSSLWGYLRFRLFCDRAVTGVPFFHICVCLDPRTTAIVRVTCRSRYVGEKRGQRRPWSG